MAIICPTITAFDLFQYEDQIQAIKPFAQRIHIDLMDGEFAPSISPEVGAVYWPDDVIADIHLMYENPMDSIIDLARLRPHMVIIHYESQVDHEGFAREIQRHGIKAGICLLQKTEVKEVAQIISAFDHVLIFSGSLGFHGGKADLSLIKKVSEVRELLPGIEIGWDGGVNADNASQLKAAGVSVFNVGSYIQEADDPWEAYAKLESVVK